MERFISIINKSFGTYKIGSIYVEPTYWQALLIVFLIFLLILTLARLRFLYLHWSLGKGTLSFLFYGFLLAILVEGFLLVSGQTLFTAVLGWKSAPKPISTILDAGRMKLVKVLGTTDEFPTYETMVNDYERLQKSDKSKVEEYVCKQ